MRPNDNLAQKIDADVAAGILGANNQSRRRHAA
jgi:hypothetical protein